jgi:hypothetical protein
MELADLNPVSATTPRWSCGHRGSMQKKSESMPNCHSSYGIRRKNGLIAIMASTDPTATPLEPVRHPGQAHIRVCSKNLQIRPDTLGKVENAVLKVEIRSAFKRHRARCVTSHFARLKCRSENLARLISDSHHCRITVILIVAVSLIPSTDVAGAMNAEPSPPTFNADEHSSAVTSSSLASEYAAPRRDRNTSQRTMRVSWPRT